jgi:hypothetical protein
VLGITNSIQLYAKLVQEFDDFYDDQGSSRHAMNFVITAYHLVEWVWKDFLSADKAKQQELGVASITEFNAYIANNSIWTAQMGDLANGSKHFQQKGLPIHKYEQGTFGTASFGELAFNEVRVTLMVDMGKLEGRAYFVPASYLFEAVMRFWRDFFRLHGPYEAIPKGRTRLADE